LRALGVSQILVLCRGAWAVQEKDTAKLYICANLDCKVKARVWKPSGRKAGNVQRLELAKARAFRHGFLYPHCSCLCRSQCMRRMPWSLCSG
jgi:hypothetical protein